MRLRLLAGTMTLLLVAVVPLLAADKDYSIKTVEKTPAPSDVPEPIRKLLGDRCLRLTSAKGDLLAELWLCKDVAAKATDAQIKNGLTYREVPESTVFGVIRFPKQITDYRKQKIPAGVYTLRLAIQPMDGDHMGTAPYSEFLLMSPVAEDKTSDRMEAKKLQEMSGKTTGGHPGVMLLFPGKAGTADPKLEKQEENHWVVYFLLDVKVGDKKTQLPVGLTLIGASSAA